MKDQIKDFIKEFVDQYQREPLWKEPLIAFAKASDPLFYELKSIVSSTHALPTDLLKDAETVISYFIPFVREIPLSNVGGKTSSRQWASAYEITNEMICNLNDTLSEELTKWGADSAVLPPTHNFDAELLVSDWSHKHVAYIAGLGKFGLHHLLITKKGCCGRLGSLVTTAKLEKTERPSGEFCLYKHDKSCKMCVEKCEFSALNLDSFNKHKCHEICIQNDKFYSDLGETDVCGKCICVVPCSFTNPVKKER